MVAGSGFCTNMKFWVPEKNNFYLSLAKAHVANPDKNGAAFNLCKESF